LLRQDAPRPRVEKALRETLLFWANYEGIAVPPLLRRIDVQAFEDAFVRQLCFRPQSPAGANASALEAIRQTSFALGWEPF